MADQNPQPTDPVGSSAPAGSGDSAYDAALAEATASQPAAPAEPPAAPTEPAAPAAAPSEPSDFTYAQLENGSHEFRLATGQVYRGKDIQEAAAAMARAQVEASRTIGELRRGQQPAPPPPAAPPQPSEIDPAADALLDLIAPRLGMKSGREVAEAFQSLQSGSQAQAEFIAEQRNQIEAANFFRAVPEFSKSQADADKIDTFLQSNNLPFTAQTAEMAYHTLKARGEFPAAPAKPAAPRNTMPAPPTGTAPATTGKAAVTETDLWEMTPEQLADYIRQAA